METNRLLNVIRWRLCSRLSKWQYLVSLHLHTHRHNSSLLDQVCLSVCVFVPFFGNIKLSIYCFILCFIVHMDFFFKSDFMLFSCMFYEWMFPHSCLYWGELTRTNRIKNTLGDWVDMVSSASYFTKCVIRESWVKHVNNINNKIMCLLCVQCLDENVRLLFKKQYIHYEVVARLFI